MSEKYIIYTMGVKEINEAVQKVLFEKGYKWYTNDQNIVLSEAKQVYIEKDNTLSLGYIPDEQDKNFKELTFRELMELPPINDIYDELAEKIKVSIMEFFVEKELDKTFKTTQDWARAEDWCGVWEKLQRKLGLTVP